MESLKIIFRRLATPMFVIILILASVLLALGEKQDALFVMSVVTFNATLGIVQELRARATLRRLELMNRPKARLLKDGQESLVDYQELKLQNLIVLQAGDEVPADVKLTETNGLECDESILTGESKPVKKQVSDLLYASTVVTAGTAKAIVEAIGEETKVGQMSAKLKSYDPQLSPLQSSISRAIQCLTIVAVVVGTLFFFTYITHDASMVRTIEVVTTATMNVVPEGLLLASTVFLAYGSLRLSKAQVLPQKISAIESLALVDLICLDKTGTLTSPQISLHKFETWLRPSDEIKKKNLKKLVAALAKEAGSNNSTSRAILAALPAPLSLNYILRQTINFSSERKMSAIKVSYRLHEYNIMMGAPEYIETVAPSSDKMQRRLTELQDGGLRVVQVALFPKGTDLESNNLSGGRSVALISFSNELRNGVIETIDFMQQQDISVRIISGDNPNTVKFIAKKAGINNSDQVIIGAELAKLKGKKWDKVVRETTIFARVLPDQKEKIITTFKKLGFYTAMVGDGVNDALAIKTADIGIAMNAGSAATKRVSDVVLLNDAFTALPMGMKVGNQIMLAIEMVAVLAFHKVLFGLVVSYLSMTLEVPYPFAPRHITFINMFLMTLPTLIVTLFTPQPTYKINPRYFWRDTLLDVFPLALLSGVGIFASYILTTGLSPDGSTGGATMTVLSATFFGMYMFFLANHMFATKQTKTVKVATIAYIAMSSLIAITSFSVGILRKFFEFYKPEGWGIILSILTVVGLAYVQYHIADRIRARRVRQIS
jgi:cation-transporting ATPase E